MSLSISQHLPRVQPGQQTGRSGVAAGHRPDDELAGEAQPLLKADGFRPSAELSEAQSVKPTGGGQKLNELKKNTERTRTQAARNRVGSPKASEARGGAANVQAPKQPEPASATKQVQQTGTGQTRLGERKRPRQMDRGAYINNLKATFGGED